VLLSAWTDDEQCADELAERAGGLAFVAAPAVVVAPPVGGWTGIGTESSWT
jgi:hypothetical protein